MEKPIDDVLAMPFWIIDILPMQVPKDGGGQYFAVEKYYLERDRLAGIKEKHIDLILKLNCYRDVSIDGETAVNPPPEHIAEEMKRRFLHIRVDGAAIQTAPDETYMTVFGADEALLMLLRTLAAGEGLYLWQPPEE